MADRTSRPLSCPYQMDPVVEASIVELRRAYPGWGPRTILYWFERDGVVRLPGRTSVERRLIRHGLVTPQARTRKRSDDKRWERSRAMELRQMNMGADSVQSWFERLVTGPVAGPVTSVSRGRTGRGS